MTRVLGMSKQSLTRYWIEFDWPRREGVVIGLMEPIGFGVTALGLDDALALVRTEFFQEWRSQCRPFAR